MILLTTWSFGVRAGAKAWQALRDGGAALDAVEATCVAAEDDAGIDSVGYGGLPDRDGHVTLDGCVMQSPSRCGSVCAVTRSRHPVTLARRVMERTPHVMLAGAGADAFAESEGLPREALLSTSAQAAWEQWRHSSAPHDGVVDKAAHWGRDRLAPPRPVDEGAASGGALFRAQPGGRIEAQPGVQPGGAEAMRRPAAGREVDPNRHHDTIGVLAIDRSGTLAGACSTSGTPYKLPGRVGDSPIIGHGLYVDPDVGAATATGAGELIMGICGSFLVVESMRRGGSPREAVRSALERIVHLGSVQAHHQVAFIALASDGTWASGAIRSGYRTTLFMGESGEVIAPEIELLAD